MADSVNEITSAVWNHIAEELGETLPFLIQEKVCEILGDDIDDQLMEITCKQVARAMGPLAFE